MSDDRPGNPADLPGHDAAGEECFASGAPDPVRFEHAQHPRPAPNGIRTFTWVILGVIALAVAALVIGLATTIGR